MEQTRTPQSELLQSRLRDHKAETAREAKQNAQEPVSFRESPGRDDDIFTEEEEERHARKSSARHFQTSPAAPSSWRYERDASRARRTSRLSSSTNTNPNNTPRAMGAREMEDHIDKLSKQNFDLKMEVFHRRERVEQLEKKLKDYPQLEEDLNSALDTNDDLVGALEARDRAVDEAVVMITALERRNQELEQQLAEAKNTPAHTTSSSSSIAAAVPQSPSRRAQKTPRKSRDQRSLHGAVSPDVSARMVALSKPADEHQERGRMPLFLKSTEPATAALRSMYVDGDQIVRPIPSYATLLSNVNSEGNEEMEMKSPRLSELSESDLRSIYGQDKSTSLEDEADGTLPSQEHMSQQANTRVSRWVADRAISPAKPSKSRKAVVQDTANGFQSLDHVLTRQPTITPAEAPVKADGRISRAPPKEKHNHTPPIPINPIFGQNMFPPTPDTMITRPSNNSTTSFGLDANPFEAAPSATKAVLPSGPQNQARSFINTNPRKQSVTPNSFLPQEFDAYDSPPQKQRGGLLDGTTDFGEPLYRGYSSDESFAAEPSWRQTRHHQTSLAGSTAIDADSLKDIAAARNSPSPPRFFDSRKRSADTGYSASRPNQQGDSLEGYNKTQIPFHSSPPAPMNQSFAAHSHIRGLSSTSSMQTPRQSQPQPLSSGIPMRQRGSPSMPPIEPTAPPSNAKSTKTLAARTASIRNRLSRRKIASSAVEEDATHITWARGNGLSQRLWFRRSSSEQGRVPLTHDDFNNGSHFSTKPPPVTPFWSSERLGVLEGSKQSTIPPSPQRSQSARHRPSLSVTSRGNQSSTSFSSITGRDKATTPSLHSTIGTEPGVSPGSRQRRPSLTGRLGSGRKGGSNTDIPPVPNTPNEYYKRDGESESARSSRWRFGVRSRSNSRTRQETIWHNTLTGLDGTAAGKRG